MDDDGALGVAVAGHAVAGAILRALINKGLLTRDEARDLLDEVLLDLEHTQAVVARPRSVEIARKLLRDMIGNVRR